MEKKKLPTPEGGSTTNALRKPHDHHNKYHRHGGWDTDPTLAGMPIYTTHATKQPKFEGRISVLNVHLNDCADASRRTNTQTQQKKLLAMYQQHLEMEMML